MEYEAIFETGNPLPEETLTVYGKMLMLNFVGAIGDPAFDNNPDAKSKARARFIEATKRIRTFCQYSSD